MKKLEELLSKSSEWQSYKDALLAEARKRSDS